MGNNRSRVAPTRTLRIIDSETRARYQNQREAIKCRRKLAGINAKHSDTMSRLAFNRYDVKAKLQELNHEIGQRDLAKTLETRTSILVFFSSWRHAIRVHFQAKLLFFLCLRCTDA